MLSQTSVRHIADELLEQARSRKFGFTDPSGLPLPPLYQCRELDVLPPGLQQEILRKATLEVGFGPLFLLIVAAWVVAFALVYAMEPTLNGEPLVPRALLMLAPLAPLLFRALLVRRAVRMIAREIGTSWPVPVRM
ncbi:MAG: hypothetical protein ACRYF7_03930 [Janthinobacterium lividum]